ncbi:MAG: HAD-IC family P-type ATPase [Candidatus Shapirobacteria bacterium]|nr:HAD-IC family P-type ATPase [Candidatus Shapirobacteria bacterium]
MVYHGLSKNEVIELQKKYGKNILPIKDNFSRPLIFFSQFKSPLVYILIFVAIISLSFGEFLDASLITIVILVNSLLGYYQELSSQKTLVSLRNILQPTALVVRNGSRREIGIQELVPGDIVALNAGDKIPGDGILLDGINLLIDESILTGESRAIEISSNDKKNSKFLRMGTTVLSGKGIMKIEKIGIETEMGKIGKSLSEIIDEKTPLQKKLEVFSNQLAKIIIVVCSVIFLSELFHHLNLWEALRLSLILSVAAIPEGLPIAVTVILAVGMKKILKKQGLVKKLLSIETLGSTSVICTDKTGTLTEGKMKVVKTNFKDEIKAQLSMILANEQRDSLEIAMWDFVKKNGQLNPQKILDSTQKIYEEPFDSTKKYSLTLTQLGGKKTAYIIGASEIILSFCNLSKNEKQKILKEIESSANSGLKVLGMAYKETGNLKKTEKFIWLGLCGIEDPLRPGVKETIKKALSAGINIKIITGDYRKTAEEIARQLGFNFDSKSSIDGVELESMSDLDLLKKINQIVIFSRITPQQKLRIVEILQKKGEIVAMTGDGVNDAPALKKSNIGVVIGTGTEVAKEAGDLILLDGNFDTIVSAIEEGRRIFSNIKKVVVYVLSNSFVEIFLIFGTTLLNIPIPLTIVQILWIHLICDGPPDIALGFEPKETDLMKQLPKTIRNEKILSSKMKLLIFGISFLIGGLSLFIFNYFAISLGNLTLGRTLVFAIAATVSLVYIFSFKNLKKPIIKTENFFENKILFFSVLYGFILIFAAIYIPFLNQILGTIPLNLFHWLIVFSVGFLATLIVEISKIFK